ncbi:MAG: hypothetical protein NVS3B7_12710 [Candidatus Elarobacter sp.]
MVPGHGPRMRPLTMPILLEDPTFDKRFAGVMPPGRPGPIVKPPPGEAPRPEPPDEEEPEGDKS